MKKDRADPKNGQCDNQRPDGAQQCTQGIWFEISDPPFRAACIFTAGDSPNGPFRLFPMPTIVPRWVILLIDDGNAPEKSLLENVNVTRRGMPVPNDG